MANQGFVLMADAKPRLKWTRQLHERFLAALAQLGGADKATPKSVMRAMGVPGLTLYHLKSHLQKYRLAKNRDSHTLHNNGKQDCTGMDRSTAENGGVPVNEKRAQPQINETMLQMQMEVQRKLQEQIEVQRHLQLRIEAQGKYLQSVLKKAQETLAGYGSNCMGMEVARAELSELVSAVDTKCLSLSFARRSIADDGAQHADCSADSCLTSSEKMEAKDGKQNKPESSSSSHNWNEGSDEINPYCNKTTEPSIGKRLCHQDEQSCEEPAELDLNR